MVSMHELGLIPHSVVSPKTIAGPTESICSCYSLPQVACFLPKVKGEGSVAALHIEVVSAMGKHLETMQKVGTSQWWLKAELRVRWGSSQRRACVMGVPCCSDGSILKGYRPDEESQGCSCNRPSVNLDWCLDLRRRQVLMTSWPSRSKTYNVQRQPINLIQSFPSTLTS